MSWSPDFNTGETPFDLSGLKNKSAIRNRADLNAAEARNIAVPTAKYLAAPPSPKLAPLTAAWMCKLHYEMFCEVWDWAGQTRTEDLNLGVSFNQVNVQLLELERDVAHWTQTCSIPIEEQAARLHHRAVVIHPFLNGNGRWARLLANIFLRQRGWGYVAWPEVALVQHGKSLRKRYLAALKAADAGNLEPLEKLHDEFRQAGF